MSANKIFQLVFSFNKEDWRWVKSYVRPLYREGSQKAQLFNLLYQYRGKKEKILGNIHSIRGNGFDHLSQKSFQNLLSSLQKNLIHALVIKELIDDREMYQSVEFQVLRNRGLYEWYDRKKSKIRRSDSENSVTRYSSLWEFKYALDTYMSNHPTKDVNGKMALASIIELWENFKLDIDLIIGLIATYRNKLYQEDWVNVEQCEFSEFNTDLQKGLYHLTLLRGDSDGSSVKAIEDLLYKEKTKFSRQLKILFSMGLIEYYRSKKTNSETNAVSTFKVNQYMDENDLLLINGQISPVRFINCISTAVSPLCGELEWTSGFLNRYEPFISENKDQSVSQIGRAMVALGRGKADEVLEILNSLFPSSSYLKRIVYSLEVRAMIILQYDREILEAKIKNMKSFIQRQKNVLGERSYLGNSQFCQALKYLVSKEYSKLHTKFDDPDFNPFYRAWIYQELMNRGDVNPLSS